jgi:hypothetical protein
MKQPNKEQKKELHQALTIIARVSLMYKAGLVSLTESVNYANKSTIPVYKETPEDFKQLMMSYMPVIIIKMSNDFPDELLEVVKEAHQAAGGTTDLDKIFSDIEIKVLDFSDMDSINEFKDAYNMVEGNVSPVEEDDLNYEDKIVGDRVMISNGLFTNMMVSSDGTQIPSESPIKPAAPELVGKKAYVIKVNCDKKYKCGGCNNDHTADILIEFEDINIKFYINGDFLKPFEETKQPNP